jgi:putative transposase
VQHSHRRYHPSQQNLTPANAYCGRGQAILLRRETINQDTIKRQRRLHHQHKAA